MNKQSYRDKISLYLEGELNENELDDFKNYIKDNPSFSREVESIKSLMNSLNNLDSTTTSSSFINTLNKRIDDIGTPKISKLFKFNFLDSNYLQVTGIAAALLIIISSSYILINQNPDINIDINTLSNENNINMENISNLANEDSNNDSTDTSTNIRLVGGKE